jgi:hypothetical protein
MFHWLKNISHLKLLKVLFIFIYFCHRHSVQGHGLGPIKRLWHYLVRQESVQKIFVKYIFGRKTNPNQQKVVSALGQTSETSDFASYDDHYMLQQMARIYHPVKIIHKEHDAITAFCINKVICLSVVTLMLINRKNTKSIRSFYYFFMLCLSN